MSENVNVRTECCTTFDAEAENELNSFRQKKTTTTTINHFHGRCPRREVIS